MPTEPPEVLPPTLEIASGKLVLFSAFAIASSVVIGVALHRAIRHPNKHLHDFHMPPRAAITLRNLHRLAYEAFPLWRQAHPLDTCPRTIEELASYTNTDTRGPYGGDANYLFTCDPKLMPPGVTHIWMRDPGEDGIPNTADDFTSDMIEDDE